MKLDVIVYPGESYSLVMRRGSTIRSMLKKLNLKLKHVAWYNGLYVNDDYVMNDDLEFNQISIYSFFGNNSECIENSNLIQWGLNVR